MEPPTFGHSGKKAIGRRQIPSSVFSFKRKSRLSKRRLPYSMIAMQLSVKIRRHPFHFCPKQNVPRHLSECEKQLKAALPLGSNPFFRATGACIAIHGCKMPYIDGYIIPQTPRFVKHKHFSFTHGLSCNHLPFTANGRKCASLSFFNCQPHNVNFSKM